MKYKIQYNWTLSYQDFLYEYLTEVYNNDLSKAVQIESKDKEHIDKLIQIYEIINGNLDKDDADYQRFFKPLVVLENMKTRLNLAGIVILLKREDGIRLLLDDLEDLWQEEFKTVDEMSFYMQSNPSIDLEFKYAITFALQHSKVLYEQYETYTSKFDLYEDEIIKLSKPLIDNLEKKVDDQYVHDLFEYLNMDIGSFSILDIYPTLVLSNGLQTLARIDDPINARVFTVRWGCFVTDELIQDADHKKKEERFLEIAKIISDKTKFDILKFCLTHERYGTEIAEYIGISGATVSHHMSILTSSNYVTVRLDKKKIFYKTNKDKVLEYINYINDIFVE